MNVPGLVVGMSCMLWKYSGSLEGYCGDKVRGFGEVLSNFYDMDEMLTVSYVFGMMVRGRVGRAELPKCLNFPVR